MKQAQLDAERLAALSVNLSVASWQALFKDDMPADIKTWKIVEAGRWQGFTIPAFLLAGMDYYFKVHPPSGIPQFMIDLEGALDRALGSGEGLVGFMRRYATEAHDSKASPSPLTWSAIALNAMIESWEHGGRVSGPGGARLLVLQRYF